MKNLIITLEYPPQVGGIASFVFNLAARLPKGETIVWAPRTAGDGEFDAKQQWRTFRGEPYFLFFWPRWARMLWQIDKIAKKEKVERIYLHHVLPVGYIAYSLKKFRKIPYSVFLHGTDLELGTRNKKNKLIKVCQYADKVIVNSIFLKNKLLNSLPSLDAGKIDVIYPCPGGNFLRDAIPERIKKLKMTLALDGKKTIISVGRFCDGKGFTRLLLLLPYILKRVPNAVCLLVGDGPKRQSLLKLVQEKNLQNCVRFLGNIEYEAMPDYYRLADLFVLLTHRDKDSEEGWGTVFLEAAACGLPVIAGQVGGVEEAVENGITGWVVDADNGAEIVETTANLLKDAESSAIMGAAGRERVLRDFTWDKQIKKL